MSFYSNKLPIFDSLSHPTFNGNWDGKSRFHSSSFEDLANEMLKNNICGSVASTYPLNEEIKIFEFQKKCTNLSKKYNLKIYPAWVIDDREQDGINYLKEIKNFQFEYSFPNIIKFNAYYIDYQDFNRIKKIIYNALDLFNGKVIIYICTYPYYELNSKDGIYDPISIISKITSLKINVPIVLLHGCVTRLMDAALYAQHFRNVYIDLSFTLCRYINSSLKKDIEYLIEFLDQKVIIGSDHPEYNYYDLRESLIKIENKLLERIKKDDLSIKFSNILYKNLQSITTCC